MKTHIRSFELIMKWQILSLKPVLPMALMFQLFIAFAVVYGFGFMYPKIDPVSAKYIVTGATTLALVTLGLVMVPQNIAQMRANKTFDYLWSLPVSRLIFPLTDFLLWSMVVLPGVIITLLLGSTRYGFSLTISPLMVPSFLLVALTAVAVGLTIAHLSPSPILTGIISNIIVFTVFFFSPINFPAERLPDTLSYIHKWLPLMYMADLVRGTVTTNMAGNLSTAFLVVGGWCIASFLALSRVITRQK